MNNFIRKVIKASAGTGKTYRLSLEYIGLLVKFAPLGIEFSEILVITFTKKATAEIRERIFEHLRAIVYENDEQLIANIKSLMDIEIGDWEKGVLKSHYEKMMLHKNKVSISTIDSFTNNIFKTVISPYLGIMNYEIKSSNDEELLSEIYDVLLDRENLDLLKEFFFRSGRKSISNYKALVESMIDKRWLIHLIKEKKEKSATSEINDDYAEKMLAEFREGFFEVLDEFQAYLNIEKHDKSAKKVIKSDIYKAVFSDDVPVSDVASRMREKFTDDEFINLNSKAIFDKNPFWNGSTVFRKNADKEKSLLLKERLDEALECLAENLFYTHCIVEQEEILQVADSILARYDEIKLREKIFTFNDVSYYTFKYLYDPELSLISEDYVTNAFYEYLATNVRFVLIDEFQDTSVIQFKILLPIIKEIISGAGIKDYGGVIAVGDEKQSIYGWRDGERDLLLHLPEIINAEQSKLDTSYRSEENIIRFVNQVFSSDSLQAILKNKGIEWLYDDVIPNKKGNKGYIEVHFRNTSPGKDEENDIHREEDAIREYVEKVLYPLLSEEKISPAGTAILARHNRHLRTIASILEELGIPYISESSTSILHHRAIKPVMFFYRFLAYRDLIDLLRFLRSDFVLMDTDKLKQILIAFKEQDTKTYSPSDILTQLEDIPEIAKLNQFIEMNCNGFDVESEAKAGGNFDLLNLTKRFIESYNVTSIFETENDVKNINLFMEIISQFEIERSEEPRSLKHFLDFCDQIDRDEDFQQLGLETANVVRLMSIHKAKGLEFDNVFLYLNVSGREGHSSGQINYYPHYSYDFNSLENYLLTYNFDYVLKQSKNKHLFEEQNRREEIEALNTFYVAATRPKANLFVYFTYQRKDGFAKYIKDIENTDDQSILCALFYSIYQKSVLDNAWQQFSQYHSLAHWGSIVSQTEVIEEETADDFSFITSYLNTDRACKLVKDEQRLVMQQQVNFKKSYLEKRLVEKGNLAHDYLSYLKYNTPSERQFAKSKTINKYGSLLPVIEIEQIVEKMDAFLNQNAEYFSPKKWDRVFNEQLIFDEKGKELRLDRMMVDSANKEILILDYKTGEVYDQTQITKYVDAVKNLKTVKLNHYEVAGKFVEVQI